MYRAGDSFQVQFVWQLPDGDFIRAILAAEVMAIDESLDRYRVRLAGLVAGRQETAEGVARPEGELATAYWGLVGELIGRQVYLAYEVADGRPIRLRLATLTGEHSFFRRL